MSYILNALRKSEQERQAVEPDTAASRILIHQPQHPRRSGKLIAALIISNLLILAYFIGFNQKTPPVETPYSTILKSPEQAPPVQAAAKAGSIDAAPVRPDTPPPALAKPAKSPSIADIVAPKKVPAPKPPAAQVPGKKPAVAPAAPANPANEPVMSEAEPPEEEPIEIASYNPVEVPVQTGIPFLYELPAEFRRNVPELKINVFVYAKDPADRFVIIDMVKYKSGQQIKDALELKEIRPNSLVVRYNNQTFQIRKP